VEVLDVYLPLLEDKSSQIVISIALMLTSTLCAQVYRTKVTEWLPPAERAKETRGKRGWERPNLIDLKTKQGGGWVAKRLSNLLQSKDVKVIIHRSRVGARY
jgi:armadillo repeat-containing protein 8